jgi:hypothetical protein
VDNIVESVKFRDNDNTFYSDCVVRETGTHRVIEPLRPEFAFTGIFGSASDVIDQMGFMWTDTANTMTWESRTYGPDAIIGNRFDIGDLGSISLVQCALFDLDGNDFDDHLIIASVQGESRATPNSESLGTMTGAVNSPGTVEIPEGRYINRVDIFTSGFGVKGVVFYDNTGQPYRQCEGQRHENDEQNTIEPLKPTFALTGMFGRENEVVIQSMGFAWTDAGNSEDGNEEENGSEEEENGNGNEEENGNENESRRRRRRLLIAEEASTGGATA